MTGNLADLAPNAVDVPSGISAQARPRIRDSGAPYTTTPVFKLTTSVRTMSDGRSIITPVVAPRIGGWVEPVVDRCDDKPPP
jgi:hypothetical protein